jgi:NitT/TauT family transport system substrate-binding protein
MLRNLVLRILSVLLIWTLGGAAYAGETIRLEWVMQGQFAGFIVAFDKGYYKEAGIDMELLPAGPDLKPIVTVAQGIDTFGVGHPNQVISARGNEAPIVMIMQHGQLSATTYISRKAKGIERVQDMAGRSVGLWFGGDEHEFLAMLNASGVDKSDVDVVSQGWNIVQWLEDGYDVMQVTRYNELLLVYEQGIGPDKLNFLDPEDYGVALVSGGVFTLEETINERPEIVQAFVTASLRGWKEAFDDPEAAAKIILNYNSELELNHQINQIKAMRSLSCAGPTLEDKFGFSDRDAWVTSQKVMFDAKIVEREIDLDKGFTNQFWENAPAAYKKVNCG